MAQGEGVRVHDDGGACAVSFCLRETVQVAGKAVAAVFHKDKAVRHAGDLIEPQVAEELRGARLCVQEEMRMAAAALHVHQVGDDFVEQPFALVAVVHGETAQRIAEAAPRGDHPVIVVVHGGDVVEIGVALDALLTKESVDLGQGAFVVGLDLCDKSRHQRSSFRK